MTLHLFRHSIILVFSILVLLIKQFICKWFFNSSQKIPLETEDHMLFHINMLEKITEKLPYAFLTRFLMRKYIKDKISYYGFEPEGMYMTHTMGKTFYYK